MSVGATLGHELAELDQDRTNARMLFAEVALLEESVNLGEIEQQHTQTLGFYRLFGDFDPGCFRLWRRLGGGGSGDSRAPHRTRVR